MTDCVVNIELRIPSQDGEDVPASGYIEFSPTKRRDLEDYIVLPDDFRVRLDDDGKATVDLAPTVEGDWAWEATERVRRGRRLYLAVPEGPGPVDYDDLVEVDPATLNPAAPIPPIWKGYVDQADAHLQEQIDAIEGSDVNTVAGVSPDGDGGIPLAGLKTALALPADTAAAVATNAQDITDEVLRAQGIEGGLRTDVDTVQATLPAKADLVDGLVPTAQIPAIALGTGQAVANRAAMLALTNVQPGDFVAITGTADKGTYILNDPDPSAFGHWLQLSVPTDVVQSVNGQNGVIVLGKGDVGLPLADNTPDSGKPVSGPQAAAIAAETAARTSAIAALNQLVQWARNPDQLIAGAVTRDSNDAATSAPVVWPDGTPGTYTADTLSTVFPGAVDGYHVTYGSPVTKTFTQPAVTRNATGAVTALPAIVVT